MNKENKWMLGIGIALAATALIAGVLIFQNRRTGRKPPKNAPQLELDNPGTQAEFPSSATESEVG